MDEPDIRGSVDLRTGGSVLMWNLASGARTIRWVQPTNQVPRRDGTYCASASGRRKGCALIEVGLHKGERQRAP